MTSQSPPKEEKQNNLITENGSDAVKFFDTSHLKADIKGHSVRGGAVTIGSQGIKFLLHTVSTVVLARLLTKADFGLIAMVAVFTEFVSLFKDLGLSTSTIQRKDITHQQVSNLFWINIAMSIFLMLVTAAISPLVAHFYDEPRLTLITIALGGTFIFGGLVAQHTALMRRQMRFTALAIVEIVSMAISIIAAIIAALLGLKYWSLVIMVAARGITSVYIVWLLSPWRPGKLTRNSGVRPMLLFGGNLTGSNILNYFIRNGDNMVIGYAMGPALLGIYTKAYALLTLPMSQINAPLHSIMIPALSRLQDEPERYRKYYLQTLSAVALITMPLAAFMFVSANEIVDILLGSQWHEVVPAFRWLGPAAFLSAISFAPGWLFVSLGKAAAQFLLALITAPVMIIGFLYGVIWGGVNGVAASVSITYSIMFILAVYWATRKSPVRFFDIVRSLALPVICSLLAAFISAIAGRPVSEYNVFVRLTVYTLTFAISYFCFIIATSTGRQLVRSMFNVISSLRNKRIINSVEK
jgi:O-antigen/teichoic acid export membrane protein